MGRLTGRGAEGNEVGARNGAGFNYEGTSAQSELDIAA